MRRNRLLIIAIGMLMVLGLTNSLLGTAWPTMRLEFDRPIQDLGFLAVVGVVAGSVSAAMSGTLARRIGLGRLLVAGPLLSVLGLVTMAVATSWTMLVVAAVMLSFGWGLMDPGINSHVALEHGPRAMNLLHATFGVGAIFGPIVMARSIAGLGDWRPAYVLGAILSALTVGAVALTRTQWRAPAMNQAGMSGNKPSLVSAAPYLGAFLLAVTVELTTGHWSFSILESRGMDLEPAARFVAAFWGGLTAGRLLGVFSGGRVSFRATLAASAGVLAVGLVWFGTDPGGMGAWGLPIVGLGIALFFPTMVSISAQRFGESSDYVIGWSFAAAGVGAGAGPWIAGEIGSRSGLDVIPWLVLGTAVALGIVGLIAARDAERNTVRVPA